MRLTVISAAPLIRSIDGWSAYSPYINEMAVWASNVNEIQFCCPVWEDTRGLLVKELEFDTVNLISLVEFDITSKRNVLKSLAAVLKNSLLIFKAMKQADHIHLRCPGNMGLLGCIIQIAFPSKPKTAKYAGNWDPKSNQPLSYKLQKWILSNTFLTKNMQVLVYGEWENQTKNIKPFFTATYTEANKTTLDFAQEEKMEELKNGTIRFLFVGTLSEGKRSLYVIQLVQQLHQKGHKVQLELFGEGKEREALTKYIRKNQLSEIITLKGNQTAETIKEAYQKGHFLVLPSKSEGWPKVVAEAMFWGCLPIATPVSCVPNMLNDEERGLLLTLDIQKDLEKAEDVISNPVDYESKINAAMNWSHEYTIDKFESEIRQLLQT